jgi:hypothetical protein
VDTIITFRLEKKNPQKSFHIPALPTGMSAMVVLANANFGTAVEEGLCEAIKEDGNLKLRRLHCVEDRICDAIKTSNLKLRRLHSVGPEFWIALYETIALYY